MATAGFRERPGEEEDRHLQAARAPFFVRSDGCFECGMRSAEWGVRVPKWSVGVMGRLRSLPWCDFFLPDLQSADFAECGVADFPRFLPSCVPYSISVFAPFCDRKQFASLRLCCPKIIRFHAVHAVHLSFLHLLPLESVSIRVNPCLSYKFVQFVPFVS